MLMFGFLAANVFCKNDNYAERFRLWGITYCFVVMAGRFCSFMKLADAD